MQEPELPWPEPGGEGERVGAAQRLEEQGGQRQSAKPTWGCQHEENGNTWQPPLCDNFQDVKSLPTLFLNNLEMIGKINM